jgi:hypothetical protein
MKEYVVSGRNGYILPTGDIDALIDQLRAISSRPLKGTFEPFSPSGKGSSVSRPNLLKNPTTETIHK